MPGKDNGVNPRKRGQRTGFCASQGKKGTHRVDFETGCICPNCGRSLPHQAGVACSSIKCLWCARPMVQG